MYAFTIGVVGSLPEDYSEEKVDQILNTAFDQFSGARAEFRVVVGFGRLARRAIECAAQRNWKSALAVTLPGSNPEIHYDGMICINGNERDKEQVERFRNRLRELPFSTGRPVVEYDNV